MNVNTCALVNMHLPYSTKQKKGLKKSGLIYKTYAGRHANELFFFIYKGTIVVSSVSILHKGAEFGLIRPVILMVTVNCFPFTSSDVTISVFPLSSTILKCSDIFLSPDVLTTPSQVTSSNLRVFVSSSWKLWTSNVEHVQKYYMKNFWFWLKIIFLS